MLVRPLIGRDAGHVLGRRSSMRALAQRLETGEHSEQESTCRSRTCRAGRTARPIDVEAELVDGGKKVAEDSCDLTGCAERGGFRFGQRQGRMDASKGGAFWVMPNSGIGGAGNGRNRARCPSATLMFTAGRAPPGPGAGSIKRFGPARHYTRRRKEVRPYLLPGG